MENWSFTYGIKIRIEIVMDNQVINTNLPTIHPINLR